MTEPTGKLKYAYETIARLEHKKDELTNMLEDVVNELDLSESACAEHGQHGTPPADLVRLVLEEKDRTIAMLKAGFKDVSNNKQ